MMPNVSGQIEYAGFVLYLSVPMIELRQSPTPLHQMLAHNMTHAVGVTTDPHAEGAEDFMDLVMEAAEDFMEHISIEVAVGTAAVGILVWEGGATINAQHEVSFHGTVRRPTAEDFAAYRAIIEREDVEAKAGALEHAQHCRSCAEKMGLDTSTIPEGPPGDSPHAVWFFRDVGEA